VRSLIDDMETWTHHPEFCIVGEPTSLRTAVGHKGKTALLATCRGKAAHSAYPHRGVNAIYMAADLIGRIRARQLHIEQSGLHDPAYETPYSTLHVGVIHGGSALNIIPAHCELELEIRNLPADDSRAMVAALRTDAAAIGQVAVSQSAADDDSTGIELKILNEYPGLDTPADSAVVALAAALTGHRDLIHVGFGSEAGLFSGQLGIPTVICGPGSIDQAHKPDEFIDLDQMQRCDTMMAALLNRLTQ
jgi:acetylornithine deacetylase